MAFTYFGFIVVVIWMALERLVSTRHQGQKLLANVLKSSKVKTVNDESSTDDDALPLTNAQGHSSIDMLSLNTNPENTGSSQSDYAAAPRHISHSLGNMSPAWSQIIRFARSEVNKGRVQDIPLDRQRELMTLY
jgi:hypothetical protein